MLRNDDVNPAGMRWLFCPTMLPSINMLSFKDTQ